MQFVYILLRKSDFVYPPQVYSQGGHWLRLYLTTLVAIIIQVVRLVNNYKWALIL